MDKEGHNIEGTDEMKHMSPQDIALTNKIIVTVCFVVYSTNAMHASLASLSNYSRLLLSTCTVLLVQNASLH